MNKTYIYAAVSFLVGAASGGALAWYFSGRKYRDKLEYESESMKKLYSEHYSSKKNKASSTDISDKVKNESVENAETNTVTSSENYVDYQTCFNNDISDDFPEYSSDDDVPLKDPYRPQVISDEEFYDEQDMTKLEINVFQNGDDYVITDDGWDPLDEPFKVIAKDDLNAFLSRDDVDEIYTVCEARNCMYSIMKQGQTWEEFLKNNPIIIETRY